jgi:hypothetical protein
MLEAYDSQEEKISLADLIPVQYSDPIAVRIQMSGEYRLLWAILEDAVDCYFRYTTQATDYAREQFRDAAEWIDSSEDEWLCSFICVCQAFQIDPDYLRRGLHQHLKTILKRHAGSLQRAA